MTRRDQAAHLNKASSKLLLKFGNCPSFMGAGSKDVFGTHLGLAFGGLMSGDLT
jgi:hypothetical protein